MPYTPGRIWSQGDYPIAVDLNKYKSGLDAIYAITGSSAVNPAVANRLNGVQGYYFVNRLRWLLYIDRTGAGAGRIEDPAGIEAAVNLSAKNVWTAFDLQSVDWIYAGKIYQVQAVSACLEDIQGL
jgi:hypothetical protein